jgi:hypothetical protein
MRPNLPNKNPKRGVKIINPSPDFHHQRFREGVLGLGPIVFQ